MKLLDCPEIYWLAEYRNTGQPPGNLIPIQEILKSFILRLSLIFPWNKCQINLPVQAGTFNSFQHISRLKIFLKHLTISWILASQSTSSNISHLIKYTQFWIFLIWVRLHGKERERVFSHIFQNNLIPWLSLVLNWIIKMDNFCSANFLQKPKETMSRLHDENWRRSQGVRKCLQCFIALRLRLVSISSVLAGYKEKNGWYREREAYNFPLHYGCTLIVCKIQIPEYLDVFYTMKSY